MSAPVARRAVAVRFDRRPAATHRLVCLPHAGGGAAFFRGWPRLFPDWLDVVALRPAGREARIAEEPVTSMPAMVEDLIDAVIAIGSEPYSLFGHSLGAVTAFELARELRRRGHPGPVRLFVSGRCAPHLPHGIEEISGLPDAEFIGAIRRLDGMPAELLDTPELLEALLPSLRADFTTAESYRYEPDSVLDVPISAFGGRADETVSPRQLKAWGELTTGTFTARLLPGGHFFIKPQAAEVAARILVDLEIG